MGTVRRRIVGVVAAVMAVGSVVGAAPAQAGPGDPVGCLPPGPGTPTTKTVTVNGFDVTINPSGAPEDVNTVDAYVGWGFNAGLNYVLCVAGDVDDPAWCLTWGPYFLATGQRELDYYVTQNPDGSVTFHGNALMADVELCV